MKNAKNETKTILVIDDRADNRALLKALLEVRGGIELLQVADGERGLALAKERQPDLIVLDLLLADGAGAELFEELKSNPETESIPVMVLTRRDAGDVPRGLRDRAEAFQTEPVGPATLLEKIEALLGPRR